MTLIETIKRLLGRPSNTVPTQDSIARVDDAGQPNRGSELDSSAQAVIDASRQRTRTYVRDAAVELETAPDNVPVDAQPPVADGPADEAHREAKRDRFQE